MVLVRSFLGWIKLHVSNGMSFFENITSIYIWDNIPQDDSYSSRHPVLSFLGLVFGLILRRFIPGLVMSTELLSFGRPSVLLCLSSSLTRTKRCHDVQQYYKSTNHNFHCKSLYILKGKRNAYFEFLNVRFILRTLVFLLLEIYTH